MERKELELNALLEITQAINANVSEESLYKIFLFTLRANLQIKKLALYVLDEEWACKVHFGTNHSFTQIPMDTSFLDIRATCFHCTDQAAEPFREFDTLIPVLHKNRLLAMAMVGGVSPLYTSLQESNTNFIQALCNIIIVAIENKRMTRRQIEQEAFKKEMEIAKQVQQGLFPSFLPNTEQLKVTAYYEPHFSIGGDYYDYLHLGEHQHMLCVADVSGKGIPAALLMSNFQATLRTLIRKTHDLREIVQELNYLIGLSAQGDHFITFFIALYDEQARKLRYINAGHNPSILMLADGKQMLLEKGTTILGALDTLPMLEMGEVEVSGNFLLFCYTDGLVETFNPNQEEFGQEALQDILTRHQQENPLVIQERIMESLHQFKQGVEFRDDITMLTLQVTHTL
ncbi:PP2C family protein-serine/threonine phosphatase [Cytophagales bacterium LB-30]|uniref:PP2C family protein-serine/threonine phosphatase n=1 Tax=Shiella aurantiaca TaxID=3058365 RepID=A0ABT8F1U9_9BACT|nr:PP2C family protein-serine/threonine phosphatase [Shiella aurantiaca]MDN4164390.1 PP2C family protein-serine/threonine phosphatase [Shiella aurantiaca]